jgi:hypothetical protein
MALTLAGLRWLAVDPATEAAFWADLLGVEARGHDLVLPGFTIRFVPADRAKSVQARIHLDLTSTSPEDQQAQVDTALRLGARPVDIGQDPAETHVVLADPEGHEFCVIAAGNRFLADTGRIGAVNCDGTHALGVFWSHALAWPLVWDEGEETAIQAPTGGSKITWSGPPLMQRDAPDRVALEVVADTRADLARLVELGATELGGGLWLDVDGNEFVVCLDQDAETPPADGPGASH